MKQRNLYLIIIGVLMVVSGLISIIVTSGEAITGTILLIAGITFLLTGIIRHKSLVTSPNLMNDRKRLERMDFRMPG